MAVPNSKDWLQLNDGLCAASGNGLIECELMASLAQAFTHDLIQPFKSMPWDIAGEGFEDEDEGSNVFFMQGSDLNHAWLRKLRREIRRMARTPRWAGWLDSAELENYEINDDGIELSILLKRGESSIAAQARIARGV